MPHAKNYIEDLIGAGDRIAKLREQRGLSQRQVARRIGITPAYVSLIEHGERQPSLQTLALIAEVLGTSTSYLIDGKPSPVEEGLAAAGFAGLHVLDDDDRRILQVELDQALFRAARDTALALGELRHYARGTA